MRWLPTQAAGWSGRTYNHYRKCDNNDKDDDVVCHIPWNCDGLNAKTVSVSNLRWIWHNKSYVCIQAIDNSLFFQHISQRVPVVWDPELRPGELYCTSAQASHWAGKPWGQSRVSGSSLTSQRWRTQPEGEQAVSCTAFNNLWRRTVSICQSKITGLVAHVGDSPPQLESRWATYWASFVWEQRLAAEPPPPESRKTI